MLRALLPLGPIENVDVVTPKVVDDVAAVGTVEDYAVVGVFVAGAVAAAGIPEDFAVWCAFDAVFLLNLPGLLCCRRLS